VRRWLSPILLLCVVFAATACTTVKVPVTISGRVVIEGGGTPLANHEVELRIFKPPWVPLGMGSYVKTAAVRTDVNGLFSLSASVPKNHAFSLQTRNPKSMYGGGSVHLRPVSSTMEVTIVHKPWPEH